MSQDIPPNVLKMARVLHFPFRSLLGPPCSAGGLARQAVETPAGITFEVSQQGRRIGIVLHSDQQVEMIRQNCSHANLPVPMTCCLFELLLDRVSLFLDQENW